MKVRNKGCLDEGKTVIEYVVLVCLCYAFECVLVLLDRYVVGIDVDTESLEITAETAEDLEVISHFPCFRVFFIFSHMTCD